jgi:hypothetical protein
VDFQPWCHRLVLGNENVTKATLLMLVIGALLIAIRATAQRIETPQAREN